MTALSTLHHPHTRSIGHRLAERAGVWGERADDSESEYAEGWWYARPCSRTPNQPTSLLLHGEVAARGQAPHPAPPPFASAASAPTITRSATTAAASGSAPAPSRG